MRRAVLLIAALGLTAAAVACRTTQPPGTEDQMPIQGPDTVREEIQNVPNEPAGPAGPVNAPDVDGGIPEGGG
ncbi:hypothetical protein D7X30_08570 [Corallococcus sp. AB011P]|uniref:hypothetical protein n=1 Tax=unclassified Corallococcus TaxID=2685029 RepID=UPI000EA1677A|nr:MULTISPECIES: hypothetical protein [unclassified Corallococcus]RKG60948.1 hypothetical protein D7X30_08570 [Corallococcus sp. AB011P]RKH88523.1 hypothetical protein D7Y21_14450 [Corallococcus sp. AB045]